MSAPLTAPAALVLAAGQGTRMRSRIPKVLHPLAGRPMIDHVLAALAEAGVERPVVVTGHAADAVEAAIGERATTARQEPQLGTADAVRVGLEKVRDERGELIVTMGDVPLQPAALYADLLAELRSGGAAIALVSARPPTRPATDGWCATPAARWPRSSKSATPTRRPARSAR